MSVVIHYFPPTAAVPATASPAAHDLAPGSTFPVPCLDFDAAADEQACFYFRAVRYAGGTVTVAIDWYADTAAAGHVVWEAALACLTPDEDDQDIETKGLASASFVQDAHLGGTPQRLHRAFLTLANNDAMAEDDWCVLRLRRDADSTYALDDLPGDASVVGISLSYTGL